MLTLLASDPLGELIDTLLFVARAVVLLVGGGVGLVYIVKGKSDENPKLVNDGFMAIGLAAAIFGATFVISEIFT